MNLGYAATVRQLLDIAPVVFTNHSLGREDALQAIAAELSAISQKLEAMGYEVRQRRNSAGNESKLMVIGPLAEVKVEVNEVFRGTLLPLQQRPLSPATEEEFAQAVSLPLLATAELYGSKLVAAMDRQHPRDLFDVLILYNDTGLTPEIVDCFVAYLAGHNRPVHEVLMPRLHPLDAAFANQFNGMTRDEVSLETLEQTRTHLVQDLPRALTDQHRTLYTTAPWPRALTLHQSTLCCSLLDGSIVRSFGLEQVLPGKSATALLHHARSLPPGSSKPATASWRCRCAPACWERDGWRATS